MTSNTAKDKSQNLGKKAVKTINLIFCFQKIKIKKQKNPSKIYYDFANKLSSQEVLNRRKMGQVQYFSHLFYRITNKNIKTLAEMMRFPLLILCTLNPLLKTPLHYFFTFYFKF